MADPYEITSDPVAPALPGRVLLRPSVDEVMASAASDVYLQATACVRAFGDFHLAVAYGAMTERLLVRLMTDPNYRALPWERTHLWSLGEERVGPGDERHSHGHLSGLVVDGSGMPEEQAHAIQAHLHDAEVRYEGELREHLGQREAGHDRLDCVVMQADAEALRGLTDPLDRLVGASEDGRRVGLTARALRGARLVMVLAMGAPARPVLEAMSGDHAGVGVAPVGGELRWYLDRRACGQENAEDPA